VADRSTTATGRRFPSTGLLGVWLCRAAAHATSFPLITAWGLPGLQRLRAVLEYEEALIVPDPRASLANGALDP